MLLQPVAFMTPMSNRAVAQKVNLLRLRPRCGRPGLRAVFLEVLAAGYRLLLMSMFAFGHPRSAIVCNGVACRHHRTSQADATGGGCGVTLKQSGSGLADRRIMMAALRSVFSSATIFRDRTATSMPFLFRPETAQASAALGDLSPSPAWPGFQELGLDRSFNDVCVMMAPPYGTTHARRRREVERNASNLLGSFDPTPDHLLINCPSAKIPAAKG